MSDPDAPVIPESDELCLLNLLAAYPLPTPEEVSSMAAVLKKARKEKVQEEEEEENEENDEEEYEQHEVHEGSAQEIPFCFFFNVCLFFFFF